MPQVGCTSGSVLVDSTNRYSSSDGVKITTIPSGLKDDTVVGVTVSDTSGKTTSDSNPSGTDPNDTPKLPIVTISSVETNSSTVITLPYVDLAELDNEVLVRCSVGLYKTSTNPVTGGTIVVDFGYIPIGGPFRPYSSQQINAPSDFNLIGYNNAFYNSEFGTIGISFDFVNNRVCRLEFIHQMYDYLAYANSAQFTNLIQNFAVRISGFNTNSRNIGITPMFVLF